MEIKINKEIRDYTESVFFGLSLRQFVCALCAIAASVGCYFGLRNTLGTEITSWVCVFVAAPFAALGFVRYNGMPLAKEAVRTWNRELGDDQKNTVSWHYGNIIAARLGLVKEAKAMNTAKLRNADRRFPAFWGPGHDWTPDHNWGGTGMVGLQETALQTYGDTIQPFACWPSDWDGSFKLHAPKRTLVEAKLEGRRVEFVKITVEEGSGRDSVELLLPGASRCSVYDENGEPVPSSAGSDRITFDVSAGSIYYVVGH